MRRERPDAGMRSVCLRFPENVMSILVRRSKGKVASYLTKRIIYDVIRKHGKQERKHKRTEKMSEMSE